MHYKVHIAENAEKTLRKISRKDQDKITEKIASLKLDPRPNGAIKLKGSGESPIYRIRYGNYRVVYKIEDNKLLVLVIEIGDRKDIYR